MVLEPKPNWFVGFGPLYSMMLCICLHPSMAAKRSAGVGLSRKCLCTVRCVRIRQQLRPLACGKGWGSLNDWFVSLFQERWHFRIPHFFGECDRLDTCWSKAAEDIYLCLRVDRCQVSWKMAYHHSNPAHICLTSGSSFSSEQSILWLKVVCKAAFSDSEVCDSLFEDLAHLAVQSIDDLGSQDWGVGTCGSLMVTFLFIFDLDWNSFSLCENTEHQCESPNSFKW